MAESNRFMVYGDGITAQSERVMAQSEMIMLQVNRLTVQGNRVMIKLEWHDVEEFRYEASFRLRIRIMGYGLG